VRRGFPFVGIAISPATKSAFKGIFMFLTAHLSWITPDLPRQMFSSYGFAVVCADDISSVHTAESEPNLTEPKQGEIR
jgi:hypothetical protein